MVMHIYDRILKSLTLRLQPNATSFLLISLFLLLVSLSLLLCLPFCFISLFLCGFPLFGEGQDFLLRSWLVSGRSQKTWFGTGTSWFATWYKEVKPRPRKKALCLDQACSQEALGEEPHRELTRVSQCPSSRHQGPQRPEDLPRLPRAWMIGSGPGCPGYLSITSVVCSLNVPSPICFLPFRARDQVLILLIPAPSRVLATLQVIKRCWIELNLYLIVPC